MSLQSLEQNLGFFKQLHFLNVKRCFSVQAVRCCTVVSPSWDFFSIILLRTQTSEPKHEQLLSTAVPHMGLQEEKKHSLLYCRGKSMVDLQCCVTRSWFSSIYTQVGPPGQPPASLQCSSTQLAAPAAGRKGSNPNPSKPPTCISEHVCLTISSAHRM